MLGSDPTDDKMITILNRRLRWAEEGLSYDADPKHVQVICEEFGLEAGSKGLVEPIAKESLGEEECEELDRNEASRFRALAARANYLAMDRMDMQYTANDLSRDMARPSRDSWVNMKRFARYLMHHPMPEWMCAKCAMTRRL